MKQRTQTSPHQRNINHRSCTPGLNSCGCSFFCICLLFEDLSLYLRLCLSVNFPPAVSVLKLSASPLCWWIRCFPSVMSSQLARRWIQGPEMLSSRCRPNNRLLVGLVHSPCRRTMATRRVNKAEEIEDMSPEIVAKRLEIMRTLEHRLPYDPWAQPVETFGECFIFTRTLGSR